jgi:hypothetical protein
MQTFIASYWFVAPAVAVLFVAMEVGYRIAKAQPLENVRESRSLSAAMVMFLGLMLTFSTNQSNLAYRKTIDLQGDERAAIAETFRRTLALPAPARESLRRAEFAYLEALTSGELRDAQCIRHLQFDVWRELLALQKKGEEKEALGPLFTSADKMIAAHWRLEHNSRNGTPVPVQVFDFVGAVLVSLLVGYSTRASNNRTWTVRLIFMGMVLLETNSLRYLERLRTSETKAHSKQLEELQQYIKDPL